MAAARIVAAETSEQVDAREFMIHRSRPYHLAIKDAYGGGDAIAAFKVKSHAGTPIGKIRRVSFVQ